MTGQGPEEGLVGPQGQQLHKEQKLIVIKVPKGGIPLSPQIPAMLSKQTGCAVIILPMDSSLFQGDLARQELDHLHASIHVIIDLPAIDFQRDDLDILYGALRYICEKTKPGDGSAQVKLMKRIKVKLDATDGKESKD